MVNRLLEHNDLPQLEKCLHATDGLATKIGNVMEHFVKIDINSTIKGVEECIGIVKTLPQDLETCNVLGHDGDRITEWAGIFLNPLKLVADITNNIAENINQIIATGSAMVRSFTSEQWEDAGIKYGDLLVLVVGKLPPRLTKSDFVISETLDNLHLLIPHSSGICKDKNGNQIPGCTYNPPKNLTLY